MLAECPFAPANHKDKDHSVCVCARAARPEGLPGTLSWTHLLVDSSGCTPRIRRP